MTKTINDVADKAHNVIEKTHDAVDKASQLAKTAELKALETSETVKAKAAETAVTVKAASEDAQQKVTDYVNAYPLKSIGIAFGAGIIASALLRR